jgi:hypothetical protein
MKKVTSFVLAVVLLMSCTDNSNFQIESENNVKRIRTGEFIILSNDDYLSDSQLLQMATYIADGYQNLEQYFPSDIEFPGQIIIHLREGEGISRSKDEYIDLYNSNRRMAPYIHEMVHSILGRNSATWMTEGIATFIDKELNDFWIFPSFQMSLSETAKYYLTYHAKLSDRALSKIGADQIIDTA